MKNTFLFLAGLGAVCFFSFTVGNKQPFVLNDIPAAQHKAALQGKLLVVQFTAKWCAPCQIMEQNTWTYPELIDYMRDNCVAAKVDIDNPDAKSYTKQYNIKNVPTILVFSADGRLVGRYENAISASHLIKYLEQCNTPENRGANQPMADEQRNDTPTLSSILEDYARQKPIADALVWANGETSLIRDAANSMIADGHKPMNNKVSVAKTGSRFIAPVSTRKDYRPSEPMANTKPQTSSQLIYTVQLGAFKSKQSAAQLISRHAKELGREVWMMAPGELHDNYYRIVSGTFYSKESAMAYVSSLKSKGLDGFVRTLPEQSAAYLSMSMR